MKCFITSLLALLAAVLPAMASDYKIVNETIEPKLIDISDVIVNINMQDATASVHRQFKPINFPKPDIYSLPYSFTRREEKWGRLAANTAVLFGGGFLTLGILQMLPEDATAWNKDKITSVPLFKRWVNNVKAGPVIDHDKVMFNFILHPYAGAAYFMSARSQGFNFLGSFLYSAFISTVFWEYGIEAFMEIPSLNDLLITPICGAIIGEGFYRCKRWIVDNGYEVLGSRAIGYILAFIVDPVNECLGYFRGNPAHQVAKDYKKHQLTYYPWLESTIFGNGGGFTVSYVF
ncbi:MAG: DUF3943 domain-containing protein [Muribaculaceae bacterium]|nr:DUF3943 domain-containing protein [Muribaculaceae bacterium]MDE6644386.1 DUF3943 domain-containing protein [Muribaculaceae bacterium]